MSDQRGRSDGAAGPARPRAAVADDGNTPPPDARGSGAGRPGDGPRVPGLDPENTTVHEALGEVPGARDVFDRFGIDACCGGELSLAAAAEHHGVDPDRVLDALARADGGS